MNTSSAQVYIDTNRTIAPISPLLFGGFAEHMGRCIYGGIYEPDSPLADARGFRTDVLAALREQQYSVIRYPGGNFLSGYHWLDGVGPQADRPRRRELAWQSLETNHFGTNEFIEFCRLLGAQPMLGVNMGTGTLDEAATHLEMIDAVLGGLLDTWDDQNGLFILTSDHGNIEDLGTRGHTRAPVPLLAWGPGAAALVDRIAALPLWPAPVEITPLHGGLSNESYTVACRGERFVVRFGTDYPFHPSQLSDGSLS